MSDYGLPHLRFEHILTHLGENPAEHHGAVIPPIYQNSLFTSPDCETRSRNYMVGGVDLDDLAGGVSQAYDYTRVCNPTTDITEAKIAALESAFGTHPHGEASKKEANETNGASETKTTSELHHHERLRSTTRARCFGSGMGAISAAILSCVKSGDHVVVPETVYGPTRQFLRDYLKRFDISVTYINGTDLQHWADAIRPNTRLFYLESPSSVVLLQQDLKGVATLARQHDISTLCDNSWATPLYQSPLALGIDLVVHSATKYLGGHSDVVAGIVIGNGDRMRKLTFDEGCLLGATLDPFASWLLLRGLRTLQVRLDRHQQSARRIAHALLEHDAVERVFYPGLPTDPQLELTRRQLRGTSGLLSFAPRENSKERAQQIVDSLKFFGIGCSWGGFESLALPAHIAGSAIGEPQTPGRWLVRIHIGLENVDDLWGDLEKALVAGC